MPPDFRLGKLSRDYAAMRPMLFANYPAFDEPTTYIVELEEQINGLQ